MVVQSQLTAINTIHKHNQTTQSYDVIKKRMKTQG